MERFVFPNSTHDLRPPLTVAVVIGVIHLTLFVANGASRRTTDVGYPTEDRRHHASVLFGNEPLLFRRFAVTTSSVATSTPRSPTRAGPARLV